MVSIIRNMFGSLPKGSKTGNHLTDAVNFADFPALADGFIKSF